MKQFLPPLALPHAVELKKNMQIPLHLILGEPRATKFYRGLYGFYRITYDSITYLNSITGVYARELKTLLSLISTSNLSVYENSTPRN